MRHCQHSLPEHTTITLNFTARLQRLFQLALLLAVALPTLAQEGDAISSYTLNTGDHVQVTVFEEPDLSINAILDDTGAISYPLLGELQVRRVELHLADKPPRAPAAPPTSLRSERLVTSWSSITPSQFLTRQPKASRTRAAPRTPRMRSRLAWR